MNGQANSTRSGPVRPWSLLEELRRHVPFTLIGTFTGVVIAGLFTLCGINSVWAGRLFWTLHPLHVLLSAMATTALYRQLARAGWFRTFVVGYVGSIGIATLSDCIIPYVGEWMIGLPNRGLHIGFIEKWWLVNPMAVLGIAVAWLLPRSKVAHAGHVLLSTWASLFHIQMALSGQLNMLIVLVMPIFLFLAVWIPCCTSDIVMPVLFARLVSHNRADRSEHTAGGESERAL